MSQLGQRECLARVSQLGQRSQGRESFSSRNSNLKFDTEDWIIHLYPFYPQIIKKRDRNAYEINSNSAVLAFIFLNKNIVKPYCNVG